MDRTSLGDRMKDYESTFKYRLTKKLPMLLRIDGKAFHSRTKSWKCNKPFDDELMDAMQQTTLNLCREIQGAVLGYTQSDEISILVMDNQARDSQAWFGKEVQKIVSISASQATVHFNGIYSKVSSSPESWGDSPPAVFDSRVFVLPDYEVINYFIWRQQDWTRNSVQMAARSVYSHNQVKDKKNAEMQDMLIEKGINWNDYTIPQKRGVCIRKVFKTWEIDHDIPIFTKDRSYIEVVMSTYMRSGLGSDSEE